MYEITGFFKKANQYNKCKIEIIDTAETKSESIYLMHQYRIAFRSDWYINMRYVEQS